MQGKSKFIGFKLFKTAVIFTVRIISRPITALTLNMLGTITHVSTKAPVVALTFDDGPDPQWTPRLVDILNRYQARATFFMIGKNAKKYPNIVSSVAEAGHEICNHTWDHSSFPLISRRERRRQILSCAEALVPYGQKLFRPPWGHQNFLTLLHVTLLGYKVITWNLHAFDWLEKDPAWMTSHLEKSIKPGSIILLHDSVCAKQYMSREPTLETVKMLLEHIGNKFSFVTVTELFNHGQPQKTNWFWKPNIEWLNRPKEQKTNTNAYFRKSGIN